MRFEYPCCDSLSGTICANSLNLLPSASVKPLDGRERSSLALFGSGESAEKGMEYTVEAVKGERGDIQLSDHRFAYA